MLTAEEIKARVARAADNVRADMWVPAVSIVALLLALAFARIASDAARLGELIQYCNTVEQ